MTTKKAYIHVMERSDGTEIRHEYDDEATARRLARNNRNLGFYSWVEVEELRDDLNAAIAEYEDALEHPDHYDVEAAKRAMDDAQRYYDECLDEIETERMWAAF